MIKTRIIIKIPSVKTNCLFARTNLTYVSNRINLNTLPKILLKLSWETKYGWISIIKTSDKKRGLVSVIFNNSKHRGKQRVFNAWNLFFLMLPKEFDRMS